MNIRSILKKIISIHGIMYLINANHTSCMRFKCDYVVTTGFRDWECNCPTVTLVSPLLQFASEQHLDELCDVGVITCFLYIRQF